MENSVTMHSIDQVSEKLNHAIQKLSLPQHPKGLYEPVSYILSLGGKRIRPLMTLLATQLFDENYYNAMPQALAIEVFHNFTLIHDDIMDEAPLRRNQPTVHLKWNTNTGILSGDAMLIKAYQLLSATAPIYLSEILTLFNDTALGVCEGQQLDMEFENREDVTIDEYIEMIRLKTAVLLACSLKTGAIIGGAPDTVADEMYQLGESLGLAFQLQDDILDAFGSEKVGKRIGGDIISNKKTYLLLSAMSLATGQIKTELMQWVAAKDFDENEKVSRVLAIYNQLGIKELAQKEMEKHASKAANLLQNIPVNEAQKENLRTVFNSLLVREF